MSIPEDLLSCKPQLRSKGARFGIKTSNTLKWSAQDYLASKTPRGTLRKEIFARAMRPPAVHDSGMQSGVEYSINKRQRWLLVQRIAEDDDVNVAPQPARIYAPFRDRRLWRVVGLLPPRLVRSIFGAPGFTRHRKSGENLYLHRASLERYDPGVTAVVWSQAVHRRTRARNASRMMNALETHRLLRGCRCKGCRKRLRKLRSTANSGRHVRRCGKLNNWYCSAERLRLRGPSQLVRQNSNLNTLYEIIAPMPKTAFPCHAERGSSHYRWNRLPKVKDTVKLAQY